MTRDAREPADLRDLPERGDPARDGAAPTIEEAAELRRRMLRDVEVASPRRWLPLTAAAAAVLVAALLLLPARGPLRAPDTGPPGSATDAERQAPRQLRFATAKGTQIIWVFDPNLAR